MFISECVMMLQDLTQQLAPELGLPMMLENDLELDQTLIFIGKTPYSLEHPKLSIKMLLSCLQCNKN